MDQAAPSPTPESAVAGLLAALRLMAERFAETFGAPSAMAVGQRYYHKERERVLRWLHDMECVLRRLLLLRAALFPAPVLREGEVLLRARRSVARPPKEGDAQTLFGPHSESDQWRVHFRLPAPPEPAWSRDFANPFFVTHRPGDGVGRDTGVRLYEVGDPRPLAERFEALLRVIHDPDHYAARLAQRLHLWRGRMERREIFLRALSAKAPVANEAGLEDTVWDLVIAARDLILARLQVFSKPRRAADHPPALAAESG